MSVKSAASFGEAASAGGEVVRVGYLKKLKTMRKKFFVLRAETADSSSRLEYYDNDKKYRSGQQPKRCISLTACFNINRRVDTKHKHVIALYTKDDCFCVVLDAEKDLDEWLKALLSLQRGEDVVDGEPPKPTFEHVWQVTMLNKGLGNSRNIIGPYHLCFTDKTLSLVRKSTTGLGAIVNSGHHTDQVEFSLMSIRRCGHSECFFYMEVGRSAITGAGELWMQTEDTNIAQSMGDIILRAMSNNNNKEDLGPKPRIRSSSANEASKPILMQRRQTHCGQKSTSYCSPSQDGVSASSKNVVEPPETTSSCSTVGYSNISTPFSSTQHPSPSTTVNQAHLHQRSSGSAVRPSQRRHSVSAGGPVSWSGMAHHQRTQSLPLAPHIENNNPCYLPRTSSKRLNNNSSASSARCMGGRERCDSMPSRARTSSEGTTGVPPPPPHPIRAHLAPHRPQSFYGRDISHSPPAGSPVSPASAACSTDSAGSSLSIDEPDAWPDYADTPLNRYGHSLTPDEPIVEEETSDSPYVQQSPTNGSPLTGGYVPMAPLSSDDGYVDMSPGGHNADMSPAASSCSITSGTPSTDMRFSEYHLEKVTSYFTPSEEDDTSSERPHRAYSVGSRPDVLKLRTKLDAANAENSRVRAFSVGSRSKGLHNHRVLPPHGHPPSTGGKSSSAPLLSGSHSQLGSQNSMERMDDLMEMDFSKPSSTNLNLGISPKNRTVPAGYVEMKPGFVESTTPDLPYMDMRPISSPLKPSSINSNSSKEYMDMKPSTSPHKSKYSNPYYVEMSGKLGTSPKSNKTSSPIQEEYMDMDFQSNRTHRTVTGSARTQPVDLPHPKKPPEGYMEMLWGRKPSLEGPKNTDDYMNMSVKKTKSKSNKKEKTRSQPITIQTNSFATFLQNTTRKTTPPKHPPNYLPLTSFNSPNSSPYSSLRRPRSRKSSRRDSRESKDATPTSETSTIFPFSPGSPIKPFNDSSMNVHSMNSNSSMTSAMTSNSSMNTQSMPSNSSMNSNSLMNTNSMILNSLMPSSMTSNPSSMTSNPSSMTSNSSMPSSITSNSSMPSSMTPNSSMTLNKCAVDASSGTVKLADYTEMSFNAPTSNYVNFTPGPPPGDDFGDYAVMRCSNDFSNLNLFKPIVEDTRLGAVSPRPGDTAPHLRNDAEPSSSTTDYEILKSRPSSVSSSSSTIIAEARPGSVSSERELHYASLDLAPLEDDTRAPSGQEQTKSPTPTLNETFKYAEIDFIKSGVKNKNNKIKH